MHAEIREDIGDLVGSRDTEVYKFMLPRSRQICALEMDRSARRRQHARKHIEERAFARAVRSDDRRHLAPLESCRDALQRDETAKPASYTFNGKKRRAHRIAFVKKVPQIPLGKNRTKRMKIDPTMICQCEV